MGRIGPLAKFERFVPLRKLFKYVLEYKIQQIDRVRQEFEEKKQNFVVIKIYFLTK